MKHVLWKGTSAIIIIAILLAGLALFGACTSNDSSSNTTTTSPTQTTTSPTQTTTSPTQTTTTTTQTTTTSKSTTTTTTSPTTTTVTFTPTNHLVLTLDFDNYSDGYNRGEKANVYFLGGDRFRLTDKYGTFTGDWTWNSATNKLTLDFDGYPAWYMTLNPDGSFSGSEDGYADGGTYQWL